MPGSWELPLQHRGGSVLCCILHVDTVSTSWALGLRKMEIPGHILALAGLPFDHARNKAVQSAIDMGADWVFFLDSDVIAPPDCIPRLMSHQQPIVSGVYCRRSSPAGVPVMLKDGKWIEELPSQPSLMEVDLVGAGCLLIHTSVLRQMQPSREGKHWFDWRADMHNILPDGTCMSEDFVFCLNAKQNHGIPILVDTSVTCQHVGLFAAEYRDIKPMDSGQLFV